jgi:hypothetical protein
MLAETQNFFLATPDHHRAKTRAISGTSYIATDRIAGRTGGNTRFDGHPPDAAHLVNLLELYNLIVGLFDRHANCSRPVTA